MFQGTTDIAKPVAGLVPVDDDPSLPFDVRPNPPFTERCGRTRPASRRQKHGDAEFKMEILSFKSSREFRAWLAKNHVRSSGIMLRIYKKGSGAVSVTYAEALDQPFAMAGSMDKRNWATGIHGYRNSHQGDPTVDGQKKIPSEPSASSSREK